ncbi:MAG: GNA1162 family protein [Sulfurimonas sp.]
MKNNNSILYTAIFLLAFILSGCGPAYVTKSSEFPKMYEQQPRSLLILPPMNESTDAEAKDYYMTTVETPFSMMGYYTFPVEMVGDIMKQEGVYDTELLYNLPMNKFQEYFGADAVLFTKIKKWDVSYMVLASTLTVAIEAKIVSTKTSQELWRYTGVVKVDLSGGNSGGGMAGLLVNAIATAVNTAAADYVTYARQANARLIYTLPAGPYHEKYMQDQDVSLVDQTPKD